MGDTNSSREFYLYEHVRLDSHAVFYVGKGSGQRARCTQGRNPHWRGVANKHGWKERIVFRTDDEELAFLAEQELISKHRRLGSPLTNMTDGGEGMSGYKMPADVVDRRAAQLRGKKRPDISARLKGVPKSEGHRRNLSESKKGTKLSRSARLAMSLTRRGRPSSMLGKKHSEESKRKIAAAVSGVLNPFYGKKHSLEAVEKMIEANVGRKDSDETRSRKSVARLGHNNPRFGVKISEDQKSMQIASLKARPRVQCPHCMRVMDESNAKRWHMDNCRSKG